MTLRRDIKRVTSWHLVVFGAAAVPRLPVAFPTALCQTGFWRTGSRLLASAFSARIDLPTLALSSCTDISTIVSLTALAAVATECRS